MFKQKSIVRIELAVIAAILAGTSLYTSEVLGKTQASPQKLVDEVWQILDKNYVDSNFNHQDWKAIRQQYLSRSYSSKKEAYGAIQEMVSKLGDRYTEFYDPQEFKALNSDISGNLSGVGLELAENEKTKALTVVAPIEGTPAFKAGILPGDLIVQINGQITQGMKIEDAVKRIVGPVGTEVVLTIKRGSQSQTFKLTRANIAIHPVTYNTQTTAAGKIGYIRLPEFTQTAPAQMHRAIEALEKQQVQGYVLDLRSDPGGLLDASLQIASMWLKQGAIVSLVNRDRVKDSYNASGHPLTNKPLVILVDKGSASASEILSGALQDDNRATLVGTRTFGKGLVQAVEPLDDGSGLKLTIAKYYTPKGRDINHVGIAPDITVELSEAQQKALVENRTLGTLADPQYASAVADLGKLIQSGANRVSLQGEK
ncbi:S41 family peptidase [Nostoc punctiforme]|uniref:Carboxyl-terminal protease n=1 Tax=Nostoc punctiforme (strain ATCC 29133 / PCC 73102) TaxID=63737 RepID=B2J2K4_NOSP7|nr:S41 family peptidase [Nostoc punctiforme]ACC80435.1 carboxyl-terminal protease [Nostoc punctiforme PCC 73102]